MIPVTKPFLPPLSELQPYLEDIWETGVLSNGGRYHVALEEALERLIGDGCKVSLFCNATSALEVAQRALNLRGEIITPAYSFPATTHAIRWVGNEPVFADINPQNMTLDPSEVERLISPKTVGIMPLHCYGNQCAVEEIDSIAQKHGLKVIYDACHSFGVEDEGGSVLRYGDISVVSLHATKVMNTFEGGMLVTKDEALKLKVDQIKNFGFTSEVSVEAEGINGKMSEFNAAVGLVQLRHLNEAVALRKERDELYRQLLSSVDNVDCVPSTGTTKKNYAYFPVLVNESDEKNRDDLYEYLKLNGIHARRYFYPLISQLLPYRGLPSGVDELLPNSVSVSERILCLPLFPDLALRDVEAICKLIRQYFS